ncbi:hypothetical protein ACQP3D_28665, partial [Escherichia coli]
CEGGKKSGGASAEQVITLNNTFLSCWLQRQSSKPVKVYVILAFELGGQKTLYRFVNVNKNLSWS